MDHWNPTIVYGLASERHRADLARAEAARGSAKASPARPRRPGAAWVSRRVTMHDRNEYDLRITEHQRRVAVFDRHGWRSAAPPAPRYRRHLAQLLLAVATRLDPALAVVAKATSPAPLAS